MSRRYKGAVISATPPVNSTSSAVGVWTLSQQMQGQGATAWPIVIGGAPYWIGTLDTSGGNRGYGVAVDYAGNVSFAGVTSGTSLEIARYNKSGTIQWQRKLSGSAYGRGINVDSVGNVYVAGYVASTNYSLLTAKYNSSGTIQWQRTVNTTNPEQTFAYGIAVDSSGNSYTVGYYDNSAIGTLVIVKYNTSGTYEWSNQYTDSSLNSYGYAITVDSSNNIYAAGDYNGQFFTLKLNSSGTIQWQKTLDVSTSSTGMGIAVDSSSNVYVTATTGSVNTILQLAKYNSSGTLQWQRKLDGAGNDFGNAIAVDSSSNVYVIGNSVVSSVTGIQIAKYNTSGTIQWQRRLTSTAGYDEGRGIAIDSFGNMYITGSSYASTASAKTVVAKLPSDGSLTGTYTVGSLSYTYAASSLTDSATTHTETTQSVSIIGFTAPVTSTLTDAATTLTSTVTTL